MVEIFKTKTDKNLARKKYFMYYACLSHFQ